MWLFLCGNKVIYVYKYTKDGGSYAIQKWKNSTEQVQMVSVEQLVPKEQMNHN